MERTDWQIALIKYSYSDTYTFRSCSDLVFLAANIKLHLKCLQVKTLGIMEHEVYTNDWRWMHERKKVLRMLDFPTPLEHSINEVDVKGSHTKGWKKSAVKRNTSQKHFSKEMQLLGPVYLHSNTMLTTTKSIPPFTISAITMLEPLPLSNLSDMNPVCALNVWYYFYFLVLSWFCFK